jgi:protease I
MTPLPDHSYDALLLPGGHAKGVMPYLESTLLHSTVREFFARGKPVGAICHGVVLAARSIAASGKSVLHGRKTTALLRSQELLAWNLTRLYLGDYYRTYPTTVEDEVTAALGQPGDFQHGPLAIARDTPDRPKGVRGYRRQLRFRPMGRWLSRIFTSPSPRNSGRRVA